LLPPPIVSGVLEPDREGRTGKGGAMEVFVKQWSVIPAGIVDRPG